MQMCAAGCGVTARRDGRCCHVTCGHVPPSVRHLLPLPVYSLPCDVTHLSCNACLCSAFEGLHSCYVTHSPCPCLLCHAGRVWVGGVIRKGGGVKVLGGLPEDTPEAPEIPTVSAKRVGKGAEERRVLLCHWHMCKVCGEKVCNIHNSKCGEV